jgi:hypothetical protein
MYACEMHACEMHAYEMLAHEMHAHEIHACQMFLGILELFPGSIFAVLRNAETVPGNDPRTSSVLVRAWVLAKSDFESSTKPNLD